MANSFLDKTGLTYLWSKIVALVGTKQDTLTFDNSPTNNSSNPVKSGGVYSALAGKAASDHTQAVNKGGTNITSYTTGDILYASGSTTLSKLNGNTTTTKKFLKSVATTSGTATAPAWDTLAASDIPNLSWSKITSDKPTTLSGYGITDAATSGHTQAVNKGGTNITSYTVGDILYASGSTTLAKLAGNTTTTKKFLKSVATTSGTAVAPAWDTLVAADIPNLDWSKITSGKPTTLSGYGITDAAASGHTQAVNKGGTNITSYAVGDILYASGTATLSKLTGNTSTTQKFLAMTGTGSAGAAPQWVDAPSGEVFTVTLSVSHQVYTANKTFTEIQSAFNSGKTVVVNVPDTGNSNFALCWLSRLTSSSASFVGFETYTYNSSTAIIRISCAISSSNSVSVSRTFVTSGHAADAITIEIYEGDPYTATCTDYANIDDIYNVAYYASSGDKGYIRALIIANGTSGTTDGAPEPPIDNQWYNLTNVEKYWDYDSNEEVWSLYYTFTFSGVFNVNGTSYLRTIKVTDASDAWDNLSGATVTYSESALGGDYLPLSGGTMTGTITLNNGVAMNTASEAGWSMNQYGNITHRRTNENDYLGIVGSVGDAIRFYYDTGEVKANTMTCTTAKPQCIEISGMSSSAGHGGFIDFHYNNSSSDYTSRIIEYASGTLTFSGNASIDGGNLYVNKGDYPYIHFRNASGAEVGGVWCDNSSKRMVIRTRPTVGSSYATDVYFPSANASANEALYAYTTRNISYNSSTKVLAITSPS